MPSHIYHVNPSGPQDDDRSLCYWNLRRNNTPLEDGVEMCEECQVMASTILRNSVQRNQITNK